MPFELPLPPELKRARWKVKIRELERREPPHVTILRGTQSWRLNLRTGEFLDRRPDPREVPPKLLEHVRSAVPWKQLCDEWNRKYPDNPVQESQAGSETT